MTRFLSATGLVALGLLAGLVIYFASAYMLLIAGLSFYAVNTAYFLAFAIWLVGAPVSLWRTRGSDARRALLFFLAGMLSFHAITCLEVLIYSPQTIVFWPRSS